MSGFRVFRSLAEAAGHFAPSGLTIGNFDGVHRGHQELFRRLTAAAPGLGIKPSVLTFDPHPTRVVAPARAPRLLSTIDQRLEWMEAAGIEQVLVLPFTPEFAQLTPEQFVQQVIVEGAGARLVLVGENFRFGARQAGDTQLLTELGANWGFQTVIVPGVIYRGHMVSSTAVRGLVQTGQVGWAGRLLARCFALRGTVVSGHGIGSKQTVPTLNLAPDCDVTPATGVYVTRTRDLFDPSRHWDSVTNVGYRPTFDGDTLTVETFLLSGFSGDTPHRIEVSFLRRLREERKFADAAALKAQILADVGRAQRYFRRLRRWTVQAS